MKQNTMVINQETAMNLWGKQFGKACKVKDFAGREMVKAAYGDRNSDFGWNVDHILPQSRGGKTTESNLICCHILTNDEKADSFPCFNANEKSFEIVKVENHYEIKEKKKDVGENETKNESVNFYDSAAGIRFFDSLKQLDENVFVGCVTIHLNGIKNTAIIDFISEIFSSEHISYKGNSGQLIIKINKYNLPTKEDTTDLLNKCVLLNTYLEYYFEPKKVVNNYSIFYGVYCHTDKVQSFCRKIEYSKQDGYYLTINNLVKSNTSAKNDLQSARPIGEDTTGADVYHYNYWYIKLRENLQKALKK